MKKGQTPPDDSTNFRYMQASTPGDYELVLDQTPTDADLKVSIRNIRRLLATLITVIVTHFQYTRMTISVDYWTKFSPSAGGASPVELVINPCWLTTSKTAPMKNAATEWTTLTYESDAGEGRPSILILTDQIN